MSISETTVTCVRRGGEAVVSGTHCAKSYIQAQEPGAPWHLAECKNCDKGKELAGQLSKKEEDDMSMKCDKCGRSFAYKARLIEHQKNCNGSGAKAKPNKPRSSAGKKTQPQRRVHKTDSDGGKAGVFKVEINPEASLNELIGLRNFIEDEIKKRLGD